MTLPEIRDSLNRAATDYRTRGQNCCAQLAELTALRITEAIKEQPCAS